MKKLLSLVCIGLVAVASCSRVDDLETRVDDLDSRVVKLEELVSTLNGQVASIDALVNTIKDGGYIQEVKSETKDGLNYYTLTLSNGKTYTIHDGAKGADGHTPVVGVKLDEDDNNYYWTVDGKYTDPKVKVNGTDGKTPEISIISGYWCIRWPGDENWTTLSVAEGEDGDSFFKDVKIGDDEVTFILASGDSFSVSLLGGFRLVCPGTTVGVSANSTAKVKYTVKGAKEGEEVVVYIKHVSEGWSASVDESAAEVSINVPSDPEGGLVIIKAINNTTSKVADQAIRFEQGVLAAANLSYEISDASGVLEIPISTNMEYEFKSDNHWLNLV